MESRGDIFYFSSRSKRDHGLQPFGFYLDKEPLLLRKSCLFRRPIFMTLLLIHVPVCGSNLNSFLLLTIDSPKSEPCILMKMFL